MITNFQTFESNTNKRWFYHATKSEHLPEIVEHGLLPNMDRETNWSWNERLSKWSRGKVFVTEKLFQAIFYGKQINQDMFCPILRIKLDTEDLIKDDQTEYDWYSTKPINGNFQILENDDDSPLSNPDYEKKWINLTEELANEIVEGEWDAEVIKFSEGLISTVPTKKMVKFLKRKFPDYYIGILPDGEIEISAGRKDYVSDIKGIESICKQLGWFISHGTRESGYYKFDQSFFDNSNFDEIVIKPVFDTTKDMYFKPSVMYHVTPVKNLPRIFKIGLIPKHKDKVTHHPDRIYLTDELELAWGLKKEFQRLSGGECEILKISTKDLDIKLYSDVDARMNGYYTMENIPPKFISILPEEEYRKHWKPIQEETEFEKTEKEIQQWKYLKDLIIKKGRVTNWHQNYDFLDFCDKFYPNKPIKYVQRQFYKIMKILVLDGISDEPIRTGLGKGSRYSELGASSQTSWTLSSSYKTKNENFDFVIKDINIYDKSQTDSVRRPSHRIMTWDEKYEDHPFYKWKDYEKGFSSIQDFFRKSLIDQFGENWLDDIMTKQHGKDWKEKFQS